MRQARRGWVGGKRRDARARRRRLIAREVDHRDRTRLWGGRRGGNGRGLWDRIDEQSQPCAEPAQRPRCGISLGNHGVLGRERQQPAVHAAQERRRRESPILGFFRGLVHRRRSSRRRDGGDVDFVETEIGRRRCPSDVRWAKHRSRHRRAVVIGPDAEVAMRAFNGQYPRDLGKVIGHAKRLTKVLTKIERSGGDAWFFGRAGELRGVVSLALADWRSGASDTEAVGKAITSYIDTLHQGASRKLRCGLALECCELDDVITAVGPDEERSMAGEDTARTVVNTDTNAPPRQTRWHARYPLLPRSSHTRHHT